MYNPTMNEMSCPNHFLKQFNNGGTQFRYR